MFTTIRSAAGLIGRHRQRWFAVVAVTALIISAMEAVGALLVLSLTQVLVNDAVPELPVVGDPTRFLPTGADPITGFALAFLGFFVLRAGAALGQAWLTTRVAQRTGAELSGELVRGYLSMPWEFHLGRNSAEIVRNALVTVEGTIHGVLLPVIDLFAATVLSLVLLAVLLAASPLATVGAVVVMGIAVGVTLAVVQPRLQRLGRRAQDASQQSYQQLQQGLDAFRDVRLHAREGHFAGRFQGAADELATVWTSRSVLTGVPRMTVELAFFSFLVGALIVVSRRGESTVDLIPTLGLFAYAGLRLQPNVARIAGSLNSLRYSEPAVADLRADLETLADADRRRVEADADPVPLGFRRSVVLDAVGYRYPAAHRDVLVDVSLELRRGEWLGVCGPTGGGKSTLVDVLTGLVVPTTGSLTVDGVVVGEHTRPWQRHLAMVHQAPLLIDDTVRRNVALGTDDDAIDDAAVWEALRRSQLQTFVETLPTGLDTLVGEHGVRLSGGQRQRLSLARALHRGADVLVLDEGTASLDNATERAVITALEELADDTTVVMVAHRLTTLERCDRVIYVEDGRIEAAGTLDELDRDSAGFRRMASDPTVVP